LSGKRERLYDLVEERRVVRRVKDPLDEVLEEEERELAREAKRLRLQEIIEKRKRELEKLKGRPERGAGGVLEDVSPVMAMEIAKLPDEQRAKVIETIRLLKSAEKASPMEWIIPLVIGSVKANPNQDVSTLADFAKTVGDQIKTGMELARSGQPQSQSSFNPVELIKTFGELIRDNVQKPMEELVQRVQPRPSALEQILMDDKLFERAKALGMFGGPVQQQPQSVTPELKKLDLEIERIKQDTALKLKEMELQQQRWMAEQQIELQKWKQVGELFQGPVGKTLQILGGGVARKISGYGGQQPSVTQLTCPKCGKQFPVFADADKAICPYCGVVLAKTGGEETAQKQAESQPEQREQ